jgi:glyoxylase-like metal-dependent hydrolase (beta-lactamase superfamily II)
MDKRQLQQFSELIYWLPPDGDTDRPVLGVIAGSHSSLIVDAGASVAHARLLLDQVAQLDIAPVRYLFLTHWHWDHVFGTDAFHVPTFAHRQTQQMVRHMATLAWSDAALDARVAVGTEIAFCRDMLRLELPDRRDLALRVPDMVFDTAVTLDLGDLTCQLIHVGGDHAADASIAYIPEEKVVFLSDCLYYDLYTIPNRITLAGIEPLYERVLALSAEAYFWGHADEVYSRAQMREEQEIMMVIGRLTVEKAGDVTAVLAQLQTTHPHLVDEDTPELIAQFWAGQTVAPNRSFLP